jgi:hypothetical protein
LIFSKAQSGRFPLDDEIREIFEALRDGRQLPASESKPAGLVNRVLDKLRK